MTHPIVTDENDLLERVRVLLEEVPYDLPPSEKDVVASLLKLRDELAAAKTEDRGSLMNQYNAQYALLGQLRDARDRPQVDPDCPYFAHITLTESGRTRDLCLGKATRIERGIRIVDWRNAPISRIFYQYQQGEEYEEELGGRTVEGVVKARRTLTIKRGELQAIHAPEGVFHRDSDGWTKSQIEAPRLAGGEGTAMQVYGAGQGGDRRLGTNLQGSRRRSDKRLPDIAGLIDPHQFSLITRPNSGFVVIRGTAGSGKTTVALHRIAWLAFDDPSIDSPRTMFLVFSKALRDYVGHVMPALGVKHASIRTFSEWCKQQKERHFPRVPRKYRDDTPGVVAAIKNHPAMLVAMEWHAQRVDGKATGEQALDDWASVLTDIDLLQAAVEHVSPGAFSRGELERVTTWCRDRAEEVVLWLDGDKTVQAELDDEDDALLLRAWQLRVGPLRGRKKTPLRYRHIAIDEVQDFSPIDVRILIDCLDKRRSITLAGDTQQHVMRDAGFTSWSDFFRHLGVEGTSVDTLRVSYRCTQQVVSFALELLGDLREDDPPVVTRSGPEVEFFKHTDHGACVAFLADALNELMQHEPMASIALLTPSPEVSAMYHSGLQHGDVPRLRHVTEQNFSFAPGVEVTEIAQVKGLEFDYVILVEASARHYPDTPTARRLLHVAATRAVHQLWLTTVGTVSPIVREAMKRE